MKLNRDSTQYTFFFALVVCIVCSFLLSLVSEGLREKKELNIALDVKKNILKAVDLKDPVDPKANAAEIVKIYDSKIKEIVVDPNGETIEGKSPADVQEGEALYPIYIYEESGQTRAYAFQIIGKGLWSTLYGYLALEPDAQTVRGITFYQQGETAGLGAEIAKNWFQDNFKGKSIWDVEKKELWPVQVIKGKVEGQKSGEDAKHFVDGISGATITSQGVTEMIDREIRKYEPFFSKIRK